jgi:Xaa-Pro aminopeptidase
MDDGRGEQLYPQFSLAERDRRWAAVRTLMREQKLDVIVVPNNTGHSTDFQANARYLSHVGGGSDADIAVVFPLEGDITAVANQAKYHWFEAVQCWTRDVREASRNYAKPTVERLKELGVEHGRIGITGLGPGTRTPIGTILYGFWKAIREAFPNAELIDATSVLDQVRYIKSEEEVAVLTKSQEIIEKAIAAKIAFAHPGVQDWEVWAEVMATLVKNGSELPFHNHWISGPNARHPMTLPSRRRLQRGDIIINEIEASWIGYRAQGVQPVFVAVADPVYAEMMKVHRVVYSRLLERIKPGITLGEIRELTDKFCAEEAPKSGHAAGVTASLNMHGRGAGDDGPLITRSQHRPEQLATKIEENMVFIFKPSLRSADGKYECVWGDTMVVTPNGGRRLGKRPHDIAVSGT